ncbi:MAG: DNA internalization-related competence protein ComEC/Rec2 [Bacillota bacterium]
MKLEAGGFPGGPGPIADGRRAVPGFPKEWKVTRPLVAFLFVYAGGILLSRHCPLPGGAMLLGTIATLVVAAILYVMAWRRQNLLIFFLFVLLGLVAGRLAVEGAMTSVEPLAGHVVTVVGRVAAEPDIRPERAAYILELREVAVGEKKGPAAGRVLVVVREPQRAYSYGDVLAVRGRLEKPLPPGNPGAFDYPAYLERQGVRVVLYAVGAAVAKTGVGGGNPVLGSALRTREALCRALDGALPPDAAAVVKGIVFGTRAAIDPRVQDAFVATGVVHILSVSGLHVGFVLALALALIRWLRVRPGYDLLVAAGLLAFYTFMTGAKPCVVRATVMGLLLLAAHRLGRDRDWPTTMAAAAFVVLLANPLALYDPGFQLSFAATWGILYLGPPLVAAFDALAARRGWRWSAAWSWALAVPLAAQLATLPLVAYYYNLVSVVALPANLVAVPLTGGILFLGLATAAAGALWNFLGTLLGPATAVLTDLFLWLVRLFAALPGAALTVATPPPLLVGAWFGLLYLAGKLGPGEGQAAALATLWRRYRPAVVFVVLALAGGFFFLFSSADGRLEVHFIDVGQGDATLIRGPDGATVLIDAGGRPGEYEDGDGAGRQVVVPYLERLGIRKLDVLVLTHPHEDHAGGAGAVLDAVKVGLVVVAPLQNGEEVPPGYRRLLERCARGGIKVRDARAGARIRAGAALNLDVLSPEEPLLQGTASDLNNNSLVLRLRYGRQAFLFTADIQQEAQARLLLSGRDLKADVLKVPHHGSAAFVPAFFETVRPAVAVVSVGADNRFALPSPAALDKLDEVGARVYRTDRDGAVIVRTDGRTLTVETGRQHLRRAA